MNLKVSLNVRGISNFKKRRAICTWCRKQKADFDVLQETHSMKETEVQWKNEWGGEMLFSHGSWALIHALHQYQGGIRNNTNYTLLSTISDPLGHFITLKVQINDKVYVVVNIYAPNKDKDLIQFFKKSSGLL